MKNTIFQLSSQLARVSPDADTLTQIRTQLAAWQGNLIEQQAFADYALRWKLAPWLYLQLRRYQLDDLLAPAILRQLADRYAAVRAENERRNGIARTFLLRCHEAGIPVAVLKGNAFVSTIYNDVGYKKMNDFDLLIRPEDWQRVQDIYFEMGCIPLGFGWGGERQKPAKYSHTGTPFISRDFGCIFGTQWGIKSPSAKYTVDNEELWKEAVPATFEGVPVYHLSPEYNLLHLVLHLGVYKCGIRDLMDLSNLLVAFPQTDLARLRALLIAANAQDKGWFAFSLMQQCAPVLPPNWLASLRPSEADYLTRRLESRLKAIEKANREIHNSYNDYFQDIEKTAIYFNLFPIFHKRILLYFKVLQLVFWPSAAIARQLSDLAPDAGLWARCRARLYAPPLVFSLIAEEIGWKFTFLLFIKLPVELLLSLRGYLRPQPSYFDYLRSLGIDPDQIKRAVKNIQ